jgi:hypothetical protein
VTCANMIAYHTMYDKLEGDFEGCEVTHIGRESNKEVDNLANIGSKCLPITPGVFFEEIFERSIKIKLAIDPALATCSGAKQSGPTPAAGTEDLSRETPQLPQQTGTRTVLQVRQPCASSQTNKHVEVGVTMGRPIPRPRSNPRRHVSATRPQNRGGCRKPHRTPRSCVDSILRMGRLPLPLSLCN